MALILASLFLKGCTSFNQLVSWPLLGSNFFKKAHSFFMGVVTLSLPTSEVLKECDSHII